MRVICLHGKQEIASQSRNKAFDIQIPKKMILTESSKIIIQNIVILFRIAIKVRQKKILC